MSNDNHRDKEIEEISFIKEIINSGSNYYLRQKSIHDY